jgi:hypothetical protein
MNKFHTKSPEMAVLERIVPSEIVWDHDVMRVVHRVVLSRCGQ